MNRSRAVTGDGPSGGSGSPPDVAHEPGGRNAARNGRPDGQKDDLPTDPALIVAEIARTRRELGETLEALSARMDVKTRAREGIAMAQTRVVEWVRPSAGRSYDPLIGAAAGAGAAAVLAGLTLVLRRRGRRRG